MSPTSVLGDANRGVIVTASDAGLAFGVNEGIALAGHAGSIAAASLLVVGPFARHAASRINVPVGVQLALSGEHELLELRPVTYAPSLLGGRGGFPVDAADAAEHADADEVRREFRAQIERARALGIAPAFLASHDDVVARQLALFDVFLDLAEEYQLPIRHGYDFGPISLDAAALARDRGHFVAASTINWAPGDVSLEDTLRSLPDGICEIIVSPALEGPELEALLDDAAARTTTLAALRAVPLRTVANDLGIAWLEWGDIRAS